MIRGIKVEVYLHICLSALGKKPCIEDLQVNEPVPPKNLEVRQLYKVVASLGQKIEETECYITKGDVRMDEEGYSFPRAKRCSMCTILGPWAFP